MNENTITITLEEYNELLRKAERIAVVERMYASKSYYSEDEIATVLGIKKREGDEVGKL